MSKKQEANGNGVCKIVRTKRTNLCDVFGQDAKYVVMSKENKVQILHSPSDKEIRNKSKKEWKLVGWVTTEENGTILLKILAKFYKDYDRLREAAN